MPISASLDFHIDWIGQMLELGFRTNCTCTRLAETRNGSLKRSAGASCPNSALNLSFTNQLKSPLTLRPYNQRC